MDGTDEVILGVTEGYANHPVGLSSSDRLHHVHIIGKSGAGKTTTLRNVAVQDIFAGRGIGVIDPHGDLARDILAEVPSNRTRDVVYFDPSDTSHPIGFNIIGQVPKSRRHLVASGVVSAFKGVFPDSFGPRMEYYFTAAVAALLECENVSLLGLQRMLSDDRYRAWVLRQVEDPIVKAIWEREFMGHDKKTRAEIVSPILNKVGPLLLSPALRNVLGQVRNRIEPRFLMDNGRIFIANLSKGTLGAESANLIGSLLVTQFQLAAMSRSDVPERERRPYFLTVDEFSSFVSDSFAYILSEVRKYGLSLMLANQHMGQIRPMIADAIKGNVGSTVAFRVGHEDADMFERAFGRAFSASAFVGLSNREAYAKLLSAGRDLAPMHLRMLPPITCGAGRQDAIIRASRQRYATKRRNVKRRISGWMASRGSGASVSPNRNPPLRRRV